MASYQQTFFNGQFVHLFRRPSLQGIHLFLGRLAISLVIGLVVRIRVAQADDHNINGLFPQRHFKPNVRVKVILVLVRIEQLGFV